MSCWGHLCPYCFIGYIQVYILCLVYGLRISGCIQRKKKMRKNLVPKLMVVRGVILQQIVQAIVAIFLFTVTGNDDAALSENSTLPRPPKAILCCDVCLRHVAILHAPIYAPQYVSIQTRPLSTPPPRRTIRVWSPLQPPHRRASSRHYWWGSLFPPIRHVSTDLDFFFFSFATIKTVDDHCGLWLPGNLFHILFQNNSAYHDVHHQLYGTKYNYSQPFFVMWDRILGTYMPYSVGERQGGGFEVRPVKDRKD